MNKLKTKAEVEAKKSVVLEYDFQKKANIFQGIKKLVLMTIIGFALMLVLSSFNDHLFLRELSLSMLIIVLLCTLRVFDYAGRTRKLKY